MPLRRLSGATWKVHPALRRMAQVFSSSARGPRGPDQGVQGSVAGPFRCTSLRQSQGMAMVQIIGEPKIHCLTSHIAGTLSETEGSGCIHPFSEARPHDHFLQSWRIKVPGPARSSPWFPGAPAELAAALADTCPKARRELRDHGVSRQLMEVSQCLMPFDPLVWPW